MSNLKDRPFGILTLDTLAIGVYDTGIEWRADGWLVIVGYGMGEVPYLSFQCRPC